MKGKLTTAIAVLTAMTGFAKAPQVNVTKIEPQDWFVGMKNKQLQLMVSGQGISQADVKIDYPGVIIDSLVKLDSPNYLFVYLTLKNAKAGTMPVTFSIGKKKKVVNYQLKSREMRGEERYGFTKADVLYMLMPDRFAQGHTDNSKVKMKTQYAVNRMEPSLRHGGDLEGIRRHLDYFKDLGVTALWFTPVLENDSPDNNGQSTYHGYATTDYYRVDPRFGTNEEYKRLIDEAHAKGLKVVMDMIFNHCGMEHPWLSDLPSKDWLNSPEWLFAPRTTATKTAEGQSTTYNGGLNELYKQTSYKLTPTVDPYASSHDLSETVDGWFVPSMPDLNQRNPHVMTYLIQNSKWWIETVGIDGIRMDTYPYADAVGMAAWMKEINEEYPNYNVVGESWVTEPAFTAALQKDSKITPTPKGYKGKEPFNTHLKTVMDFSFFDRINQAKNEETDDWWNGMNRIYNAFVYDYLYPNPSSVMAFIENHDTDRFLGNGKDTDKLKQALALLLTINRIPQLYYGTEILMNGTKQVTDGHVRADFPGGFPGDLRNAFTQEGRTAEENAMYDWLRTLLHWRQKSDVIIRGSQKQYCPQSGVYVMSHEYKGRHVMLILNGTSEKATFKADIYKEDIPQGAVARDVLTGKTVEISKDLELEPRATVLVEY